MSSSTMIRRLSMMAAATAVAGAVYLHHTPRAEACGCFTPPDPTVPVVQAGERIVFGMQDGVVTSHIQIQYKGPAEEFGWLLPLPSEPEPLQLGTDELFAQLIAQTQPKYRLDREYVGNCPFDPSRNGGFGGASPTAGGDSSQDPNDPGGSPLVLQASVGPFDYAVLKADSKEPMLTWLSDNNFYVPAGTDAAVDPYIRPGAFFLALKLRKGNEVGDIQPVVVRYRSELPMIPLVLTSVAADPDMGVMVWVLGEHRAIPRNFNNTQINDAKIDWINAGANYVKVISDAVNDAEGGRSFVTEYAGTSTVMQGILDYDWRFGDVNELAQQADAVSFVQYLVNYGYGVQSNQPPTFGVQFSSPLLAILERELPVPAALTADGVQPNDYYTNIGYYLGWYKDQYPDKFGDLDVTFDPAATAAEIDERIVQPTLEAGKMFKDHSYLTRMFTTLDPAEMVRDPVFSFNPDLPEVSNVHSGRLIYYCGAWGEYTDPNTTPARLITEDGWDLSLPNGTSDNPWLDTPMPPSRYTEVLREEGPPVVVRDRTDEIRKALGDDGAFGCQAGAAAGGGLFGLGLLGLGLIIARRRRRRS